MKEIPLAPQGSLRQSTGRLTAESLGLSKNLCQPVLSPACPEHGRMGRTDSWLKLEFHRAAIPQLYTLHSCPPKFQRRRIELLTPSLCALCGEKQKHELLEYSISIYEYTYGVQTNRLNHHLILTSHLLLYLLVPGFPCQDSNKRGSLASATSQFRHLLRL